LQILDFVLHPKFDLMHLKLVNWLLDVIDLVNKKGIIRYIYVVPEMSHLPNIDKAFEKATEMEREG
jgi:hypothetical protein